MKNKSHDPFTAFLVKGWREGRPSILFHLLFIYFCSVPAGRLALRHFILLRLQYYCLRKGGREMADAERVPDNLMQRLGHGHSESNQPLSPQAAERTH